MTPAISHLRACLHAALAGLIFVASLHCAWEWQAAFQHLAAVAKQQAAQQPLPLLPCPGCENESGCICRGATQAQPLDVAHFRASPTGTLASEQLAAPLIPSLTFGSHGLAADERFSFPPISGRQLRARYASFLL